MKVQNGSGSKRETKDNVRRQVVSHPCVIYRSHDVIVHRFYKDNAKLREENNRFAADRELLIEKVEELKSGKGRLEQDLEQQVAEYQDMMKCCANLQQEKQVMICYHGNNGLPW